MTTKQEAQQKLKELTGYVEKYEDMVKALLKDEYSKVPLTLKLDFKKNYEEIKGCL